MTGNFNFEVDPNDPNQKLALHNFLQNKSFVDVTLVSDDDQYLEAHKVILSSSSELFNRIFQNCSKVSNPNFGPSILYMKGVNHISLGQILDFIYMGKTCVPMNEIADFMALAKDLKITGLLEDGLNAPVDENVDDENMSIEESEATLSTEITNDYDEFLHLNLFSNYDEFITEVNDKNLPIEDKRTNLPTKNFNNHEKSVADPYKNPQDDKYIDHNTSTKIVNDHKKFGTSIVKFIADPNENLNNEKYKIIDMKSIKECNQSEYRLLKSSYIERKLSGEYSCKACNFTSEDKGKLRKHAETHNDNFLFLCNKCGETFTKENLAQIHMKMSHPKEEQQTKPKYTKNSKKIMNSSLEEKYKIIKMETNEEITNSSFQLLMESFIEKRASKDYACKDCNLSTSNRSHIREHVETHIDGYKWICKQCGDTFKRGYIIQRHIRKAHIYDQVFTK